MNKYEELDKQITREVMPDFAGKIIDVICPTCRGSAIICSDCEGVGHYEMAF